LVKRQTACVNPLRTGCTYKRTINTRFIKVVTLLNRAQHRFVIRRSTLRAHLVNTTARANFRVRI
jgi:hypothetical protein